MPDMLESIRRALEGRYRVDRRLGEGGMAVVYLAYDERHRRSVALKVLKPELAQSIGMDRFEREIHIAARLNHPHILPLLDSGTLDLGHGTPSAVYYVMPFVEGESLRDRLTRDGRLPVELALRFAREVADALNHAHRHGVIHRDIKPENILLSENHAVVADFGIARAVDEAGGGSMTAPGVSLGSPAYMSPEQITGEAPVDGRTDLYALACTLYEMLAGTPPWSGPSVSVMLTKRLHEAPPRVREANPAVPAAVDAAITRALAANPEQRFASPGEFADALAPQAAGAGRAAGASLRGRILGAAGIVAAALVALFGITRLARSGGAESITSLAIAPEEGDSGTAYLSEGVLEAVAGLLRRVPQFRITAPSLVAQVRRQQPGLDAIQLGERLKVAAILTWSLRRVGDSVGVSVELLRVPGGDLVWNAKYGRRIDQMASIQGDIARMISEALKLEFARSEYATMGRRPTVSGAAYDLYLRARRFEIRGVPLGANNARMLMDSAAYYGRKAIAQDPSFAQAHGLLGTYHFVTAFRGWGPFTEHVDSSLVEAHTALAIDSSVAEPYVNTISKAIYLDDDWATAQELAGRALHWSAFDSQTLQFAAIVTGETTRNLDSAISLARRATEVEPSTADFNTLGDLFMRAGRYDSAIVALRRALDLDPSVPGPRRRLIQSLEHLKRYGEAIQVRREGGDSAGAASYARGLAEEGAVGYEGVLRTDLLSQLQPLLAPPSHPYRLPDDSVPQLREERIVALYAQLGQWTDAMDWTIKLRERRPRRFRLIVANPILAAGLGGDPRFLPLVRQEGLEDLLRRPR